MASSGGAIEASGEVPLFTSLAGVSSAAEVPFPLAGTLPRALSFPVRTQPRCPVEHQPCRHLARNDAQRNSALRRKVRGHLRFERHFEDTQQLLFDSLSLAGVDLQLTNSSAWSSLPSRPSSRSLPSWPSLPS